MQIYKGPEPPWIEWSMHQGCGFCVCHYGMYRRISNVIHNIANWNFWWLVSNFLFAWIIILAPLIVSPCFQIYLYFSMDWGEIFKLKNQNFRSDRSSTLSQLIIPVLSSHLQVKLHPPWLNSIWVKVVKLCSIEVSKWQGRNLGWHTVSVAILDIKL